MPGKPYSFRYPSDVRQALEPWRDKFRDPNLLSGGGDDFEAVVRAMSDRDRAIEDYLSLGVGQGVIGRATKTSAQTVPGAETDLTSLSVTVTVPANRVIKLTGKVGFRITGTAGGDLCAVNLRLRDELDTLLSADSCYELVYANLRRDEDDVALTIFLTPSAGTHTYRLQTSRIFEVGTPVVETDSSATRPSVLLIEDIGPVGT